MFLISRTQMKTPIIFVGKADLDLVKFFMRFKEHF